MSRLGWTGLWFGWEDLSKGSHWCRHILLRLVMVRSNWSSAAMLCSSINRDIERAIVIVPSGKPYNDAEIENTVPIAHFCSEDAAYSTNRHTNFRTEKPLSAV